jgi:hypothetical protein
MDESLISISLLRRLATDGIWGTARTEALENAFEEIGRLGQRLKSRVNWSFLPLVK